MADAKKIRADQLKKTGERFYNKELNSSNNSL